MALGSDVTRHHADIPALDGFRALAIMIVMLSHVGLQHIVPGQFGVTLFFFLSGYLITTLLRRELATRDRVDFRRFYLRRAIRILPAMYLTIAVVAALAAVGLIPPIYAGVQPSELFFWTNYAAVSDVPIGLWSLAVEVHFYLAFPLVLAVLARQLSFRRCALVCLMLCAAVLAVRVWEAVRLDDLKPIAIWTHTRIDSIVFGAVLALWNNPVADADDVLPKRFRGYALAAALLLPTFLIRDETFRQTLRYSLQGLGLIVLLNTAIRDRGLVARMLNNAPMRWIATLSYTLYLIHSGLVHAFVPRDGSFPVPAVLAAFVASAGYAVLMHHGVERPLDRWRRTIETRMRAAQPDRATMPSGG